jgi:hypothetical protein
MNKHYAVLLGILLPFSGYGIIKEERMDQIDELAHTIIWNGLRDWMYILCTYQCIDLTKLPEETREWFCKRMEELKSKMKELDKEYIELEQS